MKVMGDQHVVLLAQLCLRVTLLRGTPMSVVVDTQIQVCQPMLGTYQACPILVLNANLY